MKPLRMHVIQFSKRALVPCLRPHFHKVEKKLLDAKLVPDELHQVWTEKRIDETLDHLSKLPDDAFDKFLHILEESGAYCCIFLLQKKGKQLANTRHAQETGNDMQIYGGNSDKNIPHYGQFHYRHDWYNYKMYKHDCKPRGHVLIINNKKFPTFGERTGSEKDCERLQELFSKILGFKTPQVLTNLKSNDMLHEIRKFARKSDHDSCDSCILVVMSHGCDDKVFGTDEQRRGKESSGWITTKEIQDCIEGRNAPCLRNKPKLIIIQACRSPGQQVSPAGSYQGQTTRRMVPIPCQSDVVLTDMQESSPSVDIHPHADIVIAYAACQGSKAFRTDKGSYFIKHLTDTFQESAHKEDVMTMLSEVNRRMKAHGPEHMSSSVNQLTLSWFFNPPAGGF